MFALHQGSEVAYHQTGKIYSCKFWDNDNLIRDFIPVLDNQGRAGMYDQAGKKMYYSNDSGKFSANDMCLEKTFGVCESCDPLSGEITDKSDGAKCIYTDEYGENQEGVCKSGVCDECANLVDNYKADGSEIKETTQMCCPTGYSSAVGGTCCKDPEPYCKRLEYLQSSGTQYIDTGLLPTTNSKSTIKFK